MAPKITTETGSAVPPAPRHAITVHFPGWENATKIRDRHLYPKLLSQLKSMYPRAKIHADIVALTEKFMEIVGRDPEKPVFALPFASREMADECKKFAMDPRRLQFAVTEDQISIRVFDVLTRFFLVIVPVDKIPAVHIFWAHPGMGISSRRAEEALQRINLLKEVTDEEATPEPKLEESPAQALLRERIAGLLERAPVGPPREKKVAPDDVYFFPTGMGAIYGLHRYLLRKENKISVLFGLPFHSTYHLLEDIGPGLKLFGKADAEDLDALEKYLEEEAKEGRSIQALYTEVPQNPALYTPDLTRLRTLADKYGFVLAADDTIGSFANIDVLGFADVVVTSLTKSFNGSADVIAGSVVLNPSSNKYASLKALFNEYYANEFYNADAETLEKNSRDYLPRSTTLNNNALRIAEYLQTFAEDPSSSVREVQYPTLLPSFPLYQKLMRPATEEFTPGYGCLLSVDFNSLTATKAFYDNLNVHQGPHLGMHATLALPYVMSLYGLDKLDFVEPFGMRETQIRISAGLEDVDDLLGEFNIALEAAEKAVEEEKKNAAS